MAVHFTKDELIGMKYLPMNIETELIRSDAISLEPIKNWKYPFESRNYASLLHPIRETKDLWIEKWTGIHRPPHQISL